MPKIPTMMNAQQVQRDTMPVDVMQFRTHREGMMAPLMAVGLVTNMVGQVAITMMVHNAITILPTVAMAHKMLDDMSAGRVADEAVIQIQRNLLRELEKHLSTSNMVQQ